MDIYCPACGEPWDMDSLHEEASERYGIAYSAAEYDSAAYQRIYETVSAEFRTKGCGEALHAAFTIGQSCRLADRPAVAKIADEVYAILGDDLDGAAAMLDDAEHLGMFS